MNNIQTSPSFGSTIINKMTEKQVAQALKGHYDIKPLWTSKGANTLKHTQAGIKSSGEDIVILGKDKIEDMNIFNLLKETDSSLEYIDDVGRLGRFLGDVPPQTTPSNPNIKPTNIDFLA